MNHFNFELIKFIQENAPIDLHIILSKYQKTLSTIKRAIKEINDTLHDRSKIHVINTKIITQITYQDYINFIHQFNPKHYISNSNERIKLLLLKLILSGEVNLEQFYSELNISYSTIKNDLKSLDNKIPVNLKINITKKGMRTISGDEVALRMYFCSSIFHTIEVDHNNMLILHKANFPFDQLIAKQFLSEIENESSLIMKQYHDIHQKIKLSYNSKKYLLLYLSLTTLRIKNKNIIDNISLPPLEFDHTITFFQIAKEDAFLNILLSALNQRHEQIQIKNQFLYQLIESFYHNISQTITIMKEDESELLSEIYMVLSSSLLQSYLMLDFDDKKLSDVDLLHRELFQQVKHFVKEINHIYQQQLTKNMIATIVLILKKFEIREKLQFRQQKRVYIVTNSSERKIGYFKALLAATFDIQIVSCININELYILEHSNADFVITFTNKISNYLKEKNISCIKVNFNLPAQDIALLIEAGFPSIKHKISRKKFVSEIKNMTEAELHHHLKHKYSDFFY
ncbi:helix-turn-helix domain-containing protein [Testudinibacter sp. P27/CKL/0425]